MSFSTPVAFLIFNRPDLTQIVFNAIAEAKPRKLLIVADGPRFPEEREKCERARAIIEQVGWDCEVLTNFSDENLGCKRRVSSGLNWVFEQVEEAIILEDDCVPTRSFFPFCETLLERYRNEPKVLHITGNNFQNGQRRTPHSYYFSKYVHCWGWATWRRAWKLYDEEMQTWPQSKAQINRAHMQSDERKYWDAIFDRVHAGQIDTWDYQWLYCCWLHNGLAITPEVNMVTNIGFGEESTHTSNPSALANLPTLEMPFPLKHPQCMIRDADADKCSFERVFLWHGEEPTLYDRLYRKVYPYIPSRIYRVLKHIKP